MEIIYLSPLSSTSLVERIHQESGRDPGYAIQKFNRLMAQGLQANGASVIPLSAVPISTSKSSRLFWGAKKEKADGLEYHYIPFVNVKGIRQLCLFLYSFFYVLFWGIGKRKEKAIICDALSISICIGAQLATKLNGIRSVGILTDMPGMMVFGNGKKESIATKVNRWSLSLYTHYVFLTEAMNPVVNTKNRPYIIVEGLCDSSTTLAADCRKDSPRVVMYAGSLHEKYGLKLLVDSFLSLKQGNAKLVIYGSGPYEKELRSICESNDNVEYRGLQPTEKILAAERTATLLINPRPTVEEFTKYSFPSKNMEYMASGTPLLTTRLPGIPADYAPYVYYFDGEIKEAFSEKMDEVLSLPDEELRAKGHQAQAFVLQNKNNIAQSERILKLLQ